MQKEVHIYYVNKIKTSLKNIENAKKADNVNIHSIHMNEGFIKRWLKRADILDDDLAKELVDACKKEDSVSLLRRSGWRVLEGYAL